MRILMQLSTAKGASMVEYAMVAALIMLGLFFLSDVLVNGERQFYEASRPPLEQGQAAPLISSN